MYHLALKMLFADRAKYIMLLCGLTFASLLMCQQSAVFCGIMLWTNGNLKNMRAPIWVVDPKVAQVNEVKSMRDTDVSRVRSITGVGWAVPLFSSVQQSKLPDGTFKSIQLVGIDSATMIGRPSKMIAGHLEELRLPNTVVIDDLGIERLSVGRARPLTLGDTFEINDKEARIVGICVTEKSFFGYPYVFTTYDQALQFAPKQRRMLSFILASPAQGWSVADTARQIEKESGFVASHGQTGFKAFTEEEFFSGQTFYTFVLENLRHIGALKAMGASNGLLTRMVVLQAFTVGFIGYGIGVGLTVLFGVAVLKKGMPPFALPYQIPLYTLVAILFICLFAAILGVLKIRRLEPAIVFRG
jgi:putative ABC transport system permease protein